MSGNVFDPATLRAVGELLTIAERHRIGLTFTPEAEGWRIDYLLGRRGGELVAGLDLNNTARIALIPLEELAAGRPVYPRPDPD